MLRRLGEWLRGEEGAIAPILVLLLIPIIGLVSMGTEVSGWYMKQRQLQHAADSAALAAATINDATLVSGIARYKSEAFGVATSYGMSNTGNIVVEPLNAQTCPGTGTTDCYRVTITEKVPLYLTKVVGYTGSTTMSDGRAATTIVATAIASKGGAGGQYCMIGLSTTGEAIRINGGPDVDLAGCDMKSNSNLTCNGANADTGIHYGDAVGDSQCGAIQRDSQTGITDPYDVLKNQITKPSCGGNFPQVASGGNLLTATSNLNQGFCGTVKLTQNIALTSDTTMVISNGSLDLNGFTLTTTGTAGATIVFTGENTSSGGTTYHHYPVDTAGGSSVGGIEIQAPTSGIWKGIGIIQDKTITGSKNDMDMTYTGNQPFLRVNGLIYFPNGDFTIKGAIDHAMTNTNNLYCIGVVAQTMLISGGGSIFHNTTESVTKDCSGFLALPIIPGTGGSSRASLVQ